MANLFEIGQTVTWVTGNIRSYGIVRDGDGGETVELVCFEVNGSPTRKILNVLRSILCTIKG
jgi:hypothetical protein